MQEDSWKYVCGCDIMLGLVMWVGIDDIPHKCHSIWWHPQTVTLSIPYYSYYSWADNFILMILVSNLKWGFQCTKVCSIWICMGKIEGFKFLLVGDSNPSHEHDVFEILEADIYLLCEIWRCKYLGEAIVVLTCFNLKRWFYSRIMFKKLEVQITL